MADRPMQTPYNTKTNQFGEKIRLVKSLYLACVSLVGIEPLLKDGNDFREDAFTELTNKITKSPGSNLSLIIDRAGQASEQKIEQGGQNLPECTRCVSHHDLPHVQSSLSYKKCYIRATHVKSSKHSVASFCAQSIHNCAM